MTSGWLPLSAWGVALMALALFGVLVFDLDTLPALLLAGAGACSLVTGLAVGMADRRRPHLADRGRPELVVRGSAATTIVAVGVTTALVGGAAAGPAFLWPGAGMIVLGLGGLVRERLAGRRLLRERRP
jgi:hypothetical protein